MTVFPNELDSNWRRRLRSSVLRWYDANGRTLPWRASADPYRVWISEIMLQQTTIAAVIPYFERFLQRFPDVHALASADQAEVLRLWEGLGYYSRARNLHKAANAIVSEFEGRFPASAQALVHLPGIGRYTAGAIASFAFGQPAGIVEANTLRLYSRLIGLQDDPRTTASQRTLWDFADWIVPTSRPADFNQSVMDLGSTLCRPNDPDCPACPVKTCCTSFANGLQHSIPLTAKKPELTQVTEVSLAIRRSGRYLLRRRTDDERWAGLWDFLRFEVGDKDVAGLRFPLGREPRRNRNPRQPTLFDEPADEAQPLAPAVCSTVALRTGLHVGNVRPLLQIHHTVTRYRIRLLCLLADDVSGRVAGKSGYRWFAGSALDKIPLSTTGRRFAETLRQCDAGGGHK